MTFQKIKLILGPTNTGKTFHVIQKMLDYESGMIGFPLRLLARENYEKIVAQKGIENVALVTGEEKIIPQSAKYYCCTVEAMPDDKIFEFVAVDEVQLAADYERGHIFTDRLLNFRGKKETNFIGSETVKVILKIFPHAEVITKERFSKLIWSGHHKLTRLNPKTAIMSFSYNQIYKIAELIRRQKGGAAIVMGSLSPRTRNSQVELYQNGDVDYLVATDAIGMGLNLDINNVVLSRINKFDGKRKRDLTPSELSQIAGRAGRHLNDGTFGVTEECKLHEDIISSIENHKFIPINKIYWRENNLNFSSVKLLINSLENKPQFDFFIQKKDAIDHIMLNSLSENDKILQIANSEDKVRLLWDVAQIPDFRNIMNESHLNLITNIFINLIQNGVLPDKLISNQLKHLERVDGDIDTIMNRISHIRTWTYISNKKDWVENKNDWQEATKLIEDKLSDELHKRLTQRFVDISTAKIFRKIKSPNNLVATVKIDGSVLLEGKEVGSLTGLNFKINSDEISQKELIISASKKALSSEINKRVSLLTCSEDKAFSINNFGHIFWMNCCVAKFKKSGRIYNPKIVLEKNDFLTIKHTEKINNRLLNFLSNQKSNLLYSLTLIEKYLKSEGKKTEEENKDKNIKFLQNNSGKIKAILFQLYENYGSINRRNVNSHVNKLNDDEKKSIAKFGIRIGTDIIYIPTLLKPLSIKLRMIFWCIENDFKGAELIPKDGLVSFHNNLKNLEKFWLSGGYKRIDDFLIRVDIFERVAVIIRNEGKKGKFLISDEMLSLSGTTRDQMAKILNKLGYKKIINTLVDNKNNSNIYIFEKHNKKKFKQNYSKYRKTKIKNNKIKKNIDPNSPFAVLSKLKI